jgi:hypothetical protein
VAAARREAVVSARQILAGDLEKLNETVSAMVRSRISISPEFGAFSKQSSKSTCKFG